MTTIQLPTVPNLATVIVPFSNNTSVTSTGRGTWKAWYGASLLDYTKLKTERSPTWLMNLYTRWHGA